MEADVRHILMVNGCTAYLVIVIKYPKGSDSREEGLFGLRVQEVGKAWWQKREVTGHIGSSFRNQRGAGSGAELGHLNVCPPVTDFLQLGPTSRPILSWGPRLQTREPCLEDIAHPNYSHGLMGNGFPWRMGQRSRDFGDVLILITFISRPAQWLSSFLSMCCTHLLM